MTRPRTESGLRMIAVGDLLLGDTPVSVGFGFASRYPAQAARTAFDHVQSVLRGSEIVFGNLEVPLADRSIARTPWRQAQLRGHPAYARVLRDAGFTVLSVANNHTAEHGLDAFQQTLGLLRDLGLHAVGCRGSAPWTCAPVVIDLAGIKVGFLAYSWHPAQMASGQTPVATGAVADAVADVRRLGGDVDHVVVSLHWGADFVARPSQEEVSAATALRRAGAAVVLGHHPQVVRPIEVRDNAIVAYSLGSLVADHIWYPPMRRGLMIEVLLGEKTVTLTRAVATCLEPDYRPRLRPDQVPEITASVTGASPSEYRMEARRCAHRQRLAAYRHALRNMGRFKAAVLAELVGTALGRKFLGATRRQMEGRQP